MWRQHYGRRGNVLKNLFRTFLGYNWYINDPFSEWQSGEKKNREPRATLFIYFG